MKDLEIKEQIENIQQDFPYCGNLPITAELKRQGKNINKKKIQNQNNITESFFKTLKYNEVYLNECGDLSDAKENIENFIEIVCHKRRPHSSLGYAPPEEFEAQFVENILTKKNYQTTAPVIFHFIN